MGNWWKQLWKRSQQTRTDHNPRRWRITNLYVEPLEDRTLPSAFTDLADKLAPPAAGEPRLTDAQTILTNTLNTASTKVPLLTQNGSGVLGNQFKIITSELVQTLKSELEDQTQGADEAMVSGIASALGLAPGDVLISHPGGPNTVEIKLRLHNIANTSLPINMDLALPGLPLKIGAKTTGSIDAKINYAYALAFGYDGTKLTVDPSVKLTVFGGTQPAHQFHLNATVAPSAEGSPSGNFAAEATLGLLKATLSNRQSPGLSADFNLDGIGLTGTPTFSISGTVDLKLKAAASFAATSDNSFQFPGVATDLSINWALPNGTPSVSYNNVSFELGTFVSKFVGPILREIQSFTKPLQPVFDVLTAPLPALSDLSHLIGQGDITLLGIAEKAAGRAFGPGIGQAAKLVATLIEINQALNDARLGGNQVSVPLGSFNLSADALKNGSVSDLGGGASRSSDEVLRAIVGSNAIQGIVDAINKIPGLELDAKEALSKLGLANDGFKLSFPILTDPTSVVFPLLLGHDGDLAKFDVDFLIDAPAGGISPDLAAFGAGISPTGNIKVEAHLHAAFDTKGLRDFFTKLAANPADAKPELLFDGFHIKANPDGKPQFSLSGFLGLEAGISAGLLSFGVQGGVFTGDNQANPDNQPIKINLHEPDPKDGKLRPSEIGADGCVFDAQGKLSAGVAINIKVGVKTPFGFVGFTKTFDIASVILFNKNGCLGREDAPPHPPIIAGVDGNGTMSLFLGTRAGQRQHINNTDDPNRAETWIVSHEQGDPVDTFTVRALGATQKLHGVKKIIATGNQAGQTISIQEGVQADAELTGGVKDDALTYLGGGKASLFGGKGSDRLTVGRNSKDSDLHGGDDNDALIGGGGNDKLFGDAHIDELFAGTGDQELHGGDGDDQLTAGPGRSALFGGGDNDRLIWNVGNGVPTALDGGTGATNTLEIVGGNNVDHFTASAGAGALSILANGAAFGATGIHELNLDGTGGADVIAVNDLSSIGVTRVYVNQRESSAPDGTADTVTIDARGGTNIVINEAIGTVKEETRDADGNLIPEVIGAQALLNGLPYKVFVANVEAHDALVVNAAASSAITVDPLDGVDAFTFADVPGSIPLAGRITVNGGTGTNVFHVRSASGVTTINAQGGHNTFNVGSAANTLGNIKAAVFLNGSGGSDKANINDSGDATGRTGTLTTTQVTGLGMSGGITYSALESLNVTLGSGSDTFTIVSTTAGTTTIRAGGGGDRVTVQSASGATIIRGEAGDDTLTADTLPTLRTQRDRPDDGIAGVVRDTVDLEGGSGGDNYIVNVTGDGDYVVNVRDIVGIAGTDTLTVNGTDQADNFLLRAASPPPGDPVAIANAIAFVAALHGEPAADVERINYDRALEGLTLETRGGDDRAALDDNWTKTTVLGGQGKDRFQVGQIFKSQRDAAAGVAKGDEFETMSSTRGFLSRGISFATRIEGGDDSDEFVVFRNMGVLDLFGDDGDDTFTVRTFALEGSTDVDVTGGKNADLVQYVANAPVTVHGGDGFDTLRVIGTELLDRFLITPTEIVGGGRKTIHDTIEKIIVDGAEGDDEFYVTGTLDIQPRIEISLFGGLGSDLFSISGDTVEVDAGAEGRRPAVVGPHLLTAIQSPLHIDGMGGEGTAGGLGKPVMLPGETSLLPIDGQVQAFTGTGTPLSIDTMTVLTADLEVPKGREFLNDLNDLKGKTLEISRGIGIDRFWLITDVAVGPVTTVLTLLSPGMPAPEWGLPDSASKFYVTHLSRNFFVREEEQLDSVTVFDDGNTAGDVGALSSTTLTGLGMAPAGISFANHETLEVLLGTGDETFTVTDTTAGAITAIHGGGGGDRIIVTGGGGPTSPLLVYGDTTHDRSRYAANGTTPQPGFGFAFNTDGADTIDASASNQGLAIYGGGNNDIIHGSQAGDHLGGGSSSDEIHGRGGADHIYGDSGFNQDLSERLDRATKQILSVVTVETASNDTIFGDGGDDIAFGDHGVITQTSGTQRIVTTGNVIDIATNEFGNGVSDEIHGGANDDVLLGGLGHDRVDGDGGLDIVLGDHATLTGRAAGVTTDPRYRTLNGSQLYDASGNPQIGTTWQSAPGASPWWANFFLTVDDGLSGFFGNDSLAGGADGDMVFGQAGDDVIQGDGSIGLNAGAFASPGQSAEDAGDGDDYIEGNSGRDLIYGNLGQDDIIGGSSNLFGLNAVAQRNDDADAIFGGAGTRTGANDPGDASPNGHARDADVILGDNGNIFRVLGTSGAPLTFNYDTYGPLKSIPRVSQMLDYTVGGAATDIGGSDVVQGEAGDDIVHGMAGNDVIFGQGQDDDLYGEAGHDRVYGGAGEDGILGDDGVIRTSRNGMTEPLHSLTTPNAQTNISLPGPFTGAWIYITGRIEKTPDLLAWEKGGNDVIYGGLGDDFLHGGAGDDGISGAEAQAAFYHTNADTNPLRYDPATRKLAAYDANNPLTKINGFFINFDAVNASGQKIEDGKDRLFGDLGHDWLVGGTQNDRLFGGKGDDLLNADDNHDTAGGLNNRPDDTLFADRDFVYGGDGLDVLIANTGGDRMYDWGGEFNSYLVPFSPFGNPTVVRSPNPHVQQFLLDLGRGSGADQTLTEPNGELGLFTQSDPEWGQNHGGPRDPQAGNIGGSRRDTQGGPEDDRNTALPLTLYSGPTAAASSAAQINSVDVTVNNVVVAPDPSDPSRLALFVGGGSGNDVIEVRRGSSTSMIRVVVNGTTVGEFARTSSAGTIGRVVVYGNEGNDTITVSADLPALPAVLYGGAGNDTIRGGVGNNVIDGGDGDDKLSGGTAADLMFGGLGQDILFADNGDDILIGGVYVNSEDLDAVAALLAEWTSAQSYSQRIANLRAGVGAGAYALNTSTILDDVTSDTLTGDKDQDWFWVFDLDRTDTRGNETPN